MHNFDRPLFKMLANNDTGNAKGHQGGVVIPATMDQYFPQLGGQVSAANPTIDREITAALFVETTQVGLVKTRYQYQTWGGTRSPERRLTGNLGTLRNVAHEDDFLLIERSLSDRDFYRLTLHRSGSQLYAALLKQAAGRRWGPLDVSDIPVSETQILSSLSAQQARENDPFNLFDNAAALVENRRTSVARSQAFARRVIPLYESRCAVCGFSHRDTKGRFEAEAAHIVPRGLKGADDARNGLALCRSHHWAFDRGLFGITTARHVVVPPAIAAEPANAPLLTYNGHPVREPTVAALRPADEALEWHLHEIVGL